MHSRAVRRGSSFRRNRKRGASRWNGLALGTRDWQPEIVLRLSPEHESVAIVIPIPGKRFYYNRKVNCLLAEGWIEYAGERTELSPTDLCSLGG